MKITSNIFLVLLLVCSACAQKVAPAPVSGVIDAKQLLRDVEVLSADDMQGRAIGTVGGIKAREYVLKKFKEVGITAFNDNYLQAVPYKRGDKEQPGANVIGFIKGKDHPEKYIVISAHYDHEGIKSGQIYNGADDNASGVSALFALATYFKKNQPQNSLIFAAFDGEETGVVGSRKFVAEPPVKIENIVLNVNMDMISHSDKDELYAAGTHHYPQYKPFIEKLVAQAKVKLLFGHDRPGSGSADWTFQSDHGSFHMKKIPFVYFGVEDHKDYHQPTDDYATITKEFYVRSVETILEAVKALDAHVGETETHKAK